mmetsp:Transcript_10015/g.31372  ORF Transcript_10015/g.31372 Transcript_10015/m.31372 type:complete len:501 (+) Transcript_10015:44-1546(+)
MVERPGVLEGDAAPSACEEAGRVLFRRARPIVDALLTDAPPSPTGQAGQSECEPWGPHKQDLVSLLRGEMRQLEQRLTQQMAGLSAGARALAGQLRHETQVWEADIAQLRQEFAGCAKTGDCQGVQGNSFAGVRGFREAITALQSCSRRHEQHLRVAWSLLEQQHERLASQAAVLEQHSVSVAELRQADAEALFNIQKLEDGRMKLGDEVAALARRLGLAGDEACSDGKADDTQQEWCEDAQEVPEQFASHVAAHIDRERIARQASEGALQSRLGLLEQRVVSLADTSQCQRFYIGSPDVSSPADFDGAKLAREIPLCRTAEDLVAAFARSTSGGLGEGLPLDDGAPLAEAAGRAAPLPLAKELVPAAAVLGSFDLEDKVGSMQDAVDQLWRKVSGKATAAAPRGEEGSSPLVSSPCLSMADTGSISAASTCADSAASTASGPLLRSLAALPSPWELASPVDLAAATYGLRQENAALRGLLLRLAEEPRLHDIIQSKVAT